MGTTLLYAIKVYRIVDFCGAVLTGALPKLREELATALNAIFVPISVSYFNLQWKIHSKVVIHWVRPSLVHFLFPATSCIILYFEMLPKVFEANGNEAY